MVFKVEIEMIDNGTLITVSTDGNFGLIEEKRFATGSQQETLLIINKLIKTAFKLKKKGGVKHAKTKKR